MIQIGKGNVHEVIVREGHVRGRMSREKCSDPSASTALHFNLSSAAFLSSCNGPVSSIKDVINLHTNWSSLCFGASAADRHQRY